MFFQEKDNLVTFKKLRTVFGKLGVAAVYNLGFFNELALRQSYQEFKQRFESSAKADAAKLAQVKKGLKWNQQVGFLPILTSECPGWVCYAEKTIGEEAFPFMSKVKSPQQLLGRILKTRKLLVDQSPRPIKFVSVMPCYDKKLEAVRPQISVPNNETLELQPHMEVDTVLATHELLELFQKLQVTWGDLQPLELQMPDQSADSLLSLSQAASSFASCHLFNRQSNGYLEYIFRRAAREIFGIELPEEQGLDYVQGKNKDLKEVILYDPKDTSDKPRPLLKFAMAYGFRNI